ncbi:MAG: metal-binding protein [Magnetospirillum sp.]|nr:MAG: metal-binding protein [Magnetospirillum sp.]
MSEARELACDLCSLPVPPHGPHLKFGNRELAFCCEGCRGIWQMLNGEGTPVNDKGKKYDEQ